MKKRISVLFLTVFLVLLLAVPAAAVGDSYVIDETGLLPEQTREELAELASGLSAAKDCGIYLILLEDLSDYPGCDTYEAAVEIFHGEELGLGDDRSGILLLLSIGDRECSSFICGETAEYAVDEYGATRLEESYFSLFKTYFDEEDTDALAEGCRDYILSCNTLLSRAEAGDPVRKPKTGPTIFGILIGMAISAIICYGLYRKMKNVKMQSMAEAYIAEGGLTLTERNDVFMRRTVTRRNIEKSSSSESRSGGGGHGRTSSF